MRLSEAFGAWCLRRLAGSIDVVGLERIPASGGAILAGNHISWVDPVLLACWLTPATGRPITWMGKAEALRWPLVGAFLRANGVFGVRRGAADLEAFRLAEASIRAGALLGIYPEGTRSRDGATAPFREGVALLAYRTGAPVFPVAVSGTDRLWPRGSLLPRRVPRIRLEIGAPLSVAGTPDRPDLHEAAKHLRSAVIDLLEAAPGGEGASGG